MVLLDLCSVLARPTVNDGAQHPVILFCTLSFFLSTPVGFSAPYHFLNAICLFLLAFLQHYLELEVPESIKMRRHMVQFLCITLFVSDIAAHLGFSSQISAS